MRDPAFPVLLTRHGGSTLLRALFAKRVDFLVIGGTALAFHVVRSPLDVGDLDVLVSPSLSNIESLRDVLVQLGFAALTGEADWARPANRHIPLKSAEYFCDLLTARSVDDFESLALESATFDLYGIPVAIASRDCLTTLLSRATVNGAGDARRLADLRSLAAGRSVTGE